MRVSAPDDRPSFRTECRSQDPGDPNECERFCRQRQRLQAWAPRKFKSGEQGHQTERPRADLPAFRRHPVGIDRTGPLGEAHDNRNLSR